MLNSLDLDELSQVWSTFGQPFRLSVLYEVSTVQLDTKPPQEPEMAPRVRAIGKPEIQAPYRPPEVLAIEPQSGPPGTEITVSGAFLSSWRASVQLLGSKLVDGLKLEEDHFAFHLPDDLQPGLYELCVDISHLCRKTFLLEVTAP
jgi:hypothetical protein